MNARLVEQIEDLIRAGMELLPEGGSEFSGYNAKKQSRYLLWRKNCLDAIGALNDKGAAFSARIISDENGMYFYHSSAQHIVDILREVREEAEARERERKAALERKQAEAQARERERKAALEREQAEAQAREREAQELARREEAARQAEREQEAREEARKQIEALEAKRRQEEREAPQEETELAIARREADESAAQPAKDETDSPSAPKILLYSLANHVMLKQLRNFFNELAIDPVVITHADGSWSQALGTLDESSRYYAVFLLSDRYHGQELMALGYLAGKYPSVQLCCIHAHTLALGELLPGVAHKVFSVSLDEIKFGLIKDLKAAGYSISL
ncbi:MAG: hypothetical protein ACM3Q4_07880 [Acidobacteriota bacterium]